MCGGRVLAQRVEIVGVTEGRAVIVKVSPQVRTTCAILQQILQKEDSQ